MLHNLIVIIITCIDRYVGAKGVYLAIGDGGADWVTAISMVCSKFGWMNGLYCVAHGGSKIIKAIFAIPEVCMHDNIYLPMLLSSYFFINELQAHTIFLFHFRVAHRSRKYSSL